MSLKSLTLLLLVALVVGASATITDDCMACMCFVSSNGCVMPDPVCDGKGFCGPFGISEGYWIDSGRQMGYLENCAADWDCNESTVKAYLGRYVQDASATCETYARTHFGGPSGAFQDYTLDYWYQVRNCLDYGLFTPPPAQQ